MPISSSNFTSLAYRKEPSYGATPTTSLRETHFTGESFGFTKQSIQSNNINSTRQVVDTVQTGFETQGGINIEMAPKVYDDLIEGALWSNWGTATSATIAATLVPATRTLSVASGAPFVNLVVGQYIRITGFANAINNGVKKILKKAGDNNSLIFVDNGDTLIAESAVANVKVNGSMLRNGGVRQSFFFERTHNDLDPRQYFSFNGNLVNSMNVSAQASSLLTGSFQFMGQTSEIYNDGVESAENPNGNGTGIAGSGSKSFDHVTLAPTAFNGLNAVSHVGDICINDIPVNAGDDAIYMNGLDFTIANNLRGVKAIGFLGNVDVSPGQLAITGTVKALFASDVMYRRYLSGEEFSLSYAVLDENNEGYVFSWPRVTISASSMSAGSKDQDLVEDAQWSALMSAITNTTMQVDRLYSAY